MELGAFSLSLAVRDVRASRAFYEKLGFEVFGGNEDEKWLMLRCEGTLIGLFEGMFEENLLTFNPPDVRAVQRELKEKGLVLRLEAAEGTGPAHAILSDPDGNTILLDQIE